MLFRITRAADKSQIAPVALTTLAAEGLYEVRDLSQWLVANPLLLSHRLDSPESPIVIGCEVAISPEQRVDVLAIDPDGTLVLCEVKRGEDDPLSQGLMYCGRVFSMPVEDLVSIVESYSQRVVNEIQRRLDLPEDSTLTELWEPQRRAIRLVIVAQDYPASVFHAARWLVANGVRISCLRFECFKHGYETYLMPHQVLPSVETAESYAVQRETQQRQSRTRTRNMFYSLISSGLLVPGEIVYFWDDKEIGVVRTDHIERTSDGMKCVNFYQLTGISESGSAKVRRNGELVTIGSLRQTKVGSPDEPTMLAGSAPATGTESTESTGSP